MKFLLGILFSILVIAGLHSQDYPHFGLEKSVSIVGLTFDAMEPFISPDGKILFFNNLNDGINTKLFYSERTNDSTFTFKGEVDGANQSIPPHLDAVADLDLENNFYWTSTRQYPTELDNLFHGVYENGSVKKMGRIRGDFYIYTPGWLIMDHGISYNGEELYFNNARFDSNACDGPCETKIGIAIKVNDSTFNKSPVSDNILQHVNDVDYIYYAPCITQDNLELYYTRFLKGDITTNTQVEICVSVRDTPNGIFSSPKVLFSDNVINIVEAPTLTSDKKVMYYHKKVDGLHKIMHRNRITVTGLSSNVLKQKIIQIMPNPMTDRSLIVIDKYPHENLRLILTDFLGRTIQEINTINNNQIVVNRGSKKKGIYHLQLFSGEKVIAIEWLMVN